MKDREGKHRYQKMADDLWERIEGGGLRAGERLPSLRQLHERTGLSVSTIQQAFQELEKKGLVEAREKSGFFVKPRSRRCFPEVEMEKLIPRPRKVGIHRLAEAIGEAILDTRLLPLGAAVPDQTLLPFSRLASSLRRVSGRYGKKGEMAYGDPTGLSELKREIINLGIGLGTMAREKEVVVTSGCMDAIQLCLRGVAEPGDTILVESPTYTNYLQLIEGLGMRALEVPCHPERGLDFGKTSEALERHKVKAAILCPNYQNPLGSEMPLAIRQDLVTLFARKKIPIIEDDIYGDLHFSPMRPRPLKSFDTAGTVLYCSSFSKTVSPDLRVGYALPGNFIKEVVRLKYTSVLASSRLNQMVLADFLRNGGFERHLRKMRGALMGQMGNLSAALGNVFPEGTKITSPKGGVVLWVELPGGINGLDLFHKALQIGIFIAPGALFTGTGRYGNCIRLSFGHPWTEAMGEGVKRLGALVHELAEGRGNEMRGGKRD